VARITMIEYRIVTKAELDKVKEIWEKFLQKDPMWHFTLEDAYIEIRVTKKLPLLDAYLKKKKWEYTTFKYEDNIPITRKYQSQFEHIFHGFAELAMLTDLSAGWQEKPSKESEAKQLMERICHLAHNAFGVDWWGEAQLEVQLGLGRAFGAGQDYERQQGRRSQEEMAKALEELKKTEKKK
jgi:hypothetical protein